MSKTYDCAILLSGEDPTTRLRTKKALSLYNQGKIGHIFVMGSGYGALAKQPLPQRDSELMVEYLAQNGVPQEYLFLDSESFDTFGNFVIPEARPLEGNPQPSELGSLVLITEQGHLPRAIGCAKRVYHHIDAIGSQGTYQDNLVARVFHTALMARTSHIKADPQAAEQFLSKDHPFYEEGWFDLTINERKKKMGIRCLEWLAYPTVNKVF